MSDTWKTALKKRSFWTDYFGITESNRDDYTWLSSSYQKDRSYPELENKITFTISKSFQLVFDLDEEEMTGGNIMLFHDTVSKGIELAWWFDEYDPHPYFFRWSEVKRLGQLLSSQIPECPSAPFLLLTRFSIITRDEEVEKVKKQLEAAWRSLNLFSDQELEVIIAKCCCPYDESWDWENREWYLPYYDKSWEYDENFGWYLDNDYSLRHPNNDHEIPIALFREFLQQLEQ